MFPDGSRKEAWSLLCRGQPFSCQRSRARSSSWSCSTAPSCALRWVPFVWHLAWFLDFLVLASCNSWRSLSNVFSPYAHRCEVRSEKLMYSTAIKKLSAPRTRRAQAPQRLTEINLPDKMKIAPFAQREPRSAVASSLSTPGLLYKSSPFVRQKFTFHRISLIPGTRVQFPHPLWCYL